MRIVLLSPRGMCAGVLRAIATVQRALQRFGSPLYVRREIVHNRHVIERLRARGVIFVDDLDRVPSGARVIFSAHGVCPAVVQQARRRGLQTIDATCPLVGRVHRQVQRAAARGDAVVLIGHPDHDEVVGTAGHAGQAQLTVVDSAAAAERVDLQPGRSISVVTQTTLSSDDVAGVVAVLRRRFGDRVVPATDICYATRDRQRAVRAAAASGAIDRLLVVGSPGSSNSQRLAEVARGRGVTAVVIDSAEEIDSRWLAPRPSVAGSFGSGEADHARQLSVGVTAGASTPEDVVEDVVARLGALGATTVIGEPPADSDGAPAARSPEVRFALPRELDADEERTTREDDGR